MKDWVKIAAAGVLVALAAFVAFRALRGSNAGELAYYYDLSEKRLYTAATGRIPPLSGVGGASDDGVLAVVYVCGDDPGSKADRKIAYLMTYSTELGTLKAQADDATQGKAEYPQQLQDRAWVSSNTLVRTPEDPEWHPMTSEEGQAAMAVLSAPCDDGSFPTVCSPAD